MCLLLFCFQQVAATYHAIESLLPLIMLPCFVASFLTVYAEVACVSVNYLLSCEPAKPTNCFSSQWLTDSSTASLTYATCGSFENRRAHLYGYTHQPLTSFLFHFAEQIVSIPNVSVVIVPNFTSVVDFPYYTEVNVPKSFVVAFPYHKEIDLPYYMVITAPNIAVDQLPYFSIDVPDHVPNFTSAVYAPGSASVLESVSVIDPIIPLVDGPYTVIVESHPAVKPIFPLAAAPIQPFEYLKKRHLRQLFMFVSKI